MIRRSISRATTNVATSTIRSRASVATAPLLRDSTAARSSLSSAPSWRRRTPSRDSEVEEGWRLAAWASIVLVLILLGYGGRLAEGDPPTDALYRYATAIGSIFIYGIFLLILLWISLGLPAREFFALRRPASWPKALGLALLSYVTIFVGAGLIIWALGAGDEQGLTPDSWDSSRAGAYAANFVAVAVVGPIVEELMYRGAGMTLLLLDTARRLRWS